MQLTTEARLASTALLSKILHYVVKENLALPLKRTSMFHST